MITWNSNQVSTEGGLVGTWMPIDNDPMDTDPDSNGLPAGWIRDPIETMSGRDNDQHVR